MCSIHLAGLESTCSVPLVEGVPMDLTGGGLGGRIGSVMEDG